MNQNGFTIAATLPTEEKTALMSNAALGCYVKLLCFAWREGSIPSDMGMLARLCGEQPAAMQALWPQLSRCFVEDVFKPGRLMHTDLEQQRVAAKASRAARSAAGALGAERRWSQSRTAAQATPVHAMPVAPAVLAAVESPGAAQAVPQAPQAAPAREISPGGDLFGDTLESVVVPKPAIHVPPCPQTEIIGLYQQILPANPRVLTWGGTREKHLRARWREMAVTKSEQLRGYATTAEGLEWWRSFFTHCAKSLLLTGRAPTQEGRPPFVANLEWIVRPTNFAKILEGNYHRGVK